MESQHPQLSGRVVLTNSHGIVCWDFKAQGSQGCSGPSGNGPLAGAGFLEENALVGALVMRNCDGHIWFSANGRTGAEFRDNEGFYEFDVEIK